MAGRPKVRRSGKRKRPAVKKSVAPKQEQPEVEVEDLADKLKLLRKMATNTKKTKEAEALFRKLEAKNRAAVRKGKHDPNFEEHLDQVLGQTKEAIRKLKERKEVMKGEEFRTLVPTGPRPKRKRETMLLVSVRELMHIIKALRTHEDFIKIANDNARIQTDKIDEHMGKGSLSAYLLACALEAGVGWATPAAKTHRWLRELKLLETETY